MRVARSVRWLLVVIMAIGEHATADRNWSVGGTVTLGGVGYGDLCDRFEGGRCLGGDIGFKIHAGTRVTEYLEIEASWIRLEKNEGFLGETEFDVSGPALAAMPMFSLYADHPDAGLDVFAKIGWFDWEFSGTTETASGEERFRTEGSDVFTGFGTRVRAGPMDTRLEFERFDVDGNDVKMLSAGFAYRF